MPNRIVNRLETYRRQTALVQDSCLPFLGLLLRDGAISVTRFRKFGFWGDLSIGLKEKAMKSVIERWAVVVFMSFLMFGCSSIRARTETPDKEWTVYPGIQLDIKETGGLFSGERSEPDWIKGLIATILIFDLPFSAVFDTVVVPYDLYRIYTPKHIGEARESSSQPSTR